MTASNTLKAQRFTGIGRRVARGISSNGTDLGGCRKTQWHLRKPRSHAPRGNAYRNWPNEQPPVFARNFGGLMRTVSFTARIGMHYHAERGNEFGGFRDNLLGGKALPSAGFKVPHSLNHKEDLFFSFVLFVCFVAPM